MPGEAWEDGSSQRLLPHSFFACNNLRGLDSQIHKFVESWNFWVERSSD